MSLGSYNAKLVKTALVKKLSPSVALKMHQLCAAAKHS